MKPIRLLACALLAAPCARAQETSLTVYADGRLLVRRTVPVAVPRGATTLGVDLGVRQLDLGSLASLDSGVQLLGARLIEVTGQQGSLQRAVGSEVEFQVGPDSAPRLVRGTLLSLDPIAVRIGDRIRYSLPGSPVFPDSLVQLAPRVDLTVEAARPANALRLMYLSSGLMWQASYTVMTPRTGAGQGTVAGTATIQNPGQVSFRGASVQLLAGDVRRVMPMRPPAAPAMVMARAQEAAAAPQEEAVGGTHVYALPGVVDFAPGQTRTVALFPRATAAVQTEYALRSQTYGALNQWPEAMRDQHPEVGYRVRRPAAAPFGGVPLPGGLVRVYQPDSAGRPQLLGEATIEHTAAGVDLMVTTGTDFDITATRTQTAFERQGDRQTASAYRVELRNAKSEPVTVRVSDVFPGENEVLSSTVPAERVSASTIAFAVPVPARGAAVLEYRVRVRW